MTQTIEAPAPQRTELRDEYYLHALAWANEHRMDSGLEPLTDLPVGQPRRQFGCTLARAIGGPVSPTYGDWPRRNTRVLMFIKRFDSGRYRWLIER